jgi:hypothetical protein
MQSYRKRIAVQMQHKSKKAEFNPFNGSQKIRWDDVRSYILKAIRMHEDVAKRFEPLSDEEKLCREELLKYKIDLEIMDRGTYEEGKEVVKKYGGIIGKAIHEG